MINVQVPDEMIIWEREDVSEIEVESVVLDEPMVAMDETIDEHIDENIFVDNLINQVNEAIKMTTPPVSPNHII